VPEARQGVGECS